MKRKFFLDVSIVIVCLSVLCGCYNTKENDISVLETESRRPEKLVVCMSAVSHTFANEDGEETLYPSKYAVGTILAGGETNAPNGNIFEMALQEYEEMTVISSASDVESAAQLETYEIETLWVKLGNHATNEGATMKMDVTKGTNTTQNTYNLNFTVNGSYISITDFISDIENDDTLGFKIEEFKMVPSGSDSNLQATFVCKDIAIKEITETTPITTTDDTGTNTTNSNNTNTNTSNTANTSNTTNTTNSAQ